MLPLFPTTVMGGVVRGYDVAPDGRRLLMVRQKSELGIEVALNWVEELKQRVPTKP